MALYAEDTAKLSQAKKSVQVLEAQLAELDKRQKQLQQQVEAKQPVQPAKPTVIMPLDVYSAILRQRLLTLFGNASNNHPLTEFKIYYY